MFALGAAVAGDAEPDQGATTSRIARIGTSSEIATTTRAASATRKPSAPPPLPSRRPAPLTTSLTTRQATTAPTRQQSAQRGRRVGAVEQEAGDEADHGGEHRHPAAGGAVRAGGAGEHPDRDADAELEQCRRKSTRENLTPGRVGVDPAHFRDDRMPEPPHRRRAHTSSRDLERYAGLFAERTAGDALLGDARPDGGHRAARGDLAGRRAARHLDLPAADLRRADDPDRPGVGGRGAPVRADRGLRGDRRLHPRGDGRRGDAARPRRRDRHHRRPAGDRPGLQDAGRSRRRGDLRGADLPGRGPGLLQLPGRRRSRSSATATGCRSRNSRTLLARLDARRAAAEVHLLGADLPEPGRGDDVAASGGGAWSSWPGSRELLVVEDNPYGLLRFGGEPLPPLYQLDGGDFVIYIGTFSKILSPGHPPRLGGGAAAGDGEDRARQAGRRPLHLDPDPVLRPRVLRRRRAGASTSRAWSSIYRGRRDAMVEALARALPGRRRPGPSRRAGSSSGRPCPTTSTPATCWRRRCATTSPSSPAQAAYVDGRGAQLDAAQLLRRRRGRDPRGNPPDRQGDRRAGRALRGPDGRAARRRRLLAASRRGRSPRTWCPSARPERAAREGRGAQRRPLAGARRLAALGGPGRGRAGAARPRGAAARRRRRPGQAADGRAARRRLRRPARRRRRGRHRAGAARDPRHPLHRARRRRLRALHGQGRWPSTRCARPASRPRTGSPSTRPPSASSAPPTRSAASRSGSASRSWSSPAAAARRSGSSSPPTAVEVPEALVSAFSYDDRVLLERFVEGRELAVSVLGDEALPVVEAIPGERRPLRLRGALRDRPHPLRLPGRARATTSGGGHRGGARRLRGARLLRLRPRRPDPRRRTARRCSRSTRSPASPTPASSPRPPRRPGCRFEQLVERILELALAPAAA